MYLLALIGAVTVIVKPSFEAVLALDMTRHSVIITSHRQQRRGETLDKTVSRLRNNHSPTRATAVKLLQIIISNNHLY